MHDLLIAGIPAIGGVLAAWVTVRFRQTDKVLDVVQKALERCEKRVAHLERRLDKRDTEDARRKP